MSIMLDTITDTATRIGELLLAQVLPEARRAALMKAADERRAAQTEERMHDALGSRRLKCDLFGLAAEQLGKRCLRVADMLTDVLEPTRSTRGQRLEVGVRFFAHRRTQRAEGSKV